MQLNGQKRLCSDLLHVIDDLCQADVVFVVQEKSLGGIRSVLSLRCETLAGMLNGEFMEACSKGTPIPMPMFDDAYVAFRAFLIYLHTGATSLHCPLDIIDLYNISDFFLFDELKLGCVSFLRDVDMHDEFCIEMLRFAMKHDIMDILETVAGFISLNADAVLANSKAAIKLSSTFLRFLFQSSDVEVSEMTLVRIVLELDSEQDADLRSELIRHVRLPLISAKDMVQVVAPCKLFDGDAVMNALAYQLDPCSVSQPPEATTPRRMDFSLSRRMSIRGAAGSAFVRRFMKEMRQNSRAFTEKEDATEFADEEEDDADSDRRDNEDIDLIVKQVGCSRSQAVTVLRSCGSVVDAIMRLSSDYEQF